MKHLSKTIMALIVMAAISFTGCRETKKEEAQDDHGHEHNPDGSHMEQEDLKQEEFTVGQDTLQKEEHGHSHDDDHGHSHDDDGHQH